VGKQPTRDAEVLAIAESLRLVLAGVVKRNAVFQMGTSRNELANP
jgi:hypothetical protein